MTKIDNAPSVSTHTQTPIVADFNAAIQQQGAQNTQPDPGKPYKSGTVITRRAGIDADMNGTADDIFVVGDGKNSAVYVLKGDCNWVKLEGVTVEENLPSTYMYSDGNPEYDEMRVERKPGFLSYHVNFPAHVALRENSTKVATADSVPETISVQLPMYDYSENHHTRLEELRLFIAVDKNSPDAAKITPRLPEPLEINTITNDSPLYFYYNGETPVLNLKYNVLPVQNYEKNANYETRHPWTYTSQTVINTNSKEELFERRKMITSKLLEIGEPLLINITEQYVPYDSNRHILHVAGYAQDFSASQQQMFDLFDRRLPIDQFPPCGEEQGHDIVQFNAVYALDRYNVSAISSTAEGKTADRLHYGFTEMGGCQVWHQGKNDRNRTYSNVTIRDEKDANGKYTGFKIASFSADTELTAANIKFDGQEDTVEIRWNPLQPNDQSQISISTRFGGSTPSGKAIASNRTLRDYDGDGQNEIRKTWDISQVGASFNPDPNQAGGNEFEFNPELLPQENTRIIMQHTNTGTAVE